MNILNAISDPKLPSHHASGKRSTPLEDREPERSSRLALSVPPAGGEIARWDEDGGAPARQISSGWNRQAASVPSCVDVAGSGDAEKLR